MTLMLSVIKLNGVILGVVMLSVVEPFHGSTVVEYLTHNLTIKGLNPATSNGGEDEKKQYK